MAPLGGPRATVENPWLRCYQSLVCLLYVKMLNLTFTSRKLLFFVIRRLHFFCFLHSINKILKKTSLDLSSFLGFNFDDRLITFQTHLCRGIIVEINAELGPPKPFLKKVERPGPPRFRHLLHVHN